MESPLRFTNDYTLRESKFKIFFQLHDNGEIMANLTNIFYHNSIILPRPVTLHQQALTTLLGDLNNYLYFGRRMRVERNYELWGKHLDAQNTCDWLKIGLYNMHLPL